MRLWVGVFVLVGVCAAVSTSVSAQWPRYTDA